MNILQRLLVLNRPPQRILDHERALLLPDRRVGVLARVDIVPHPLFVLLPLDILQDLRGVVAFYCNHWRFDRRELKVLDFRRFLVGEVAPEGRDRAGLVLDLSGGDRLGALADPDDIDALVFGGGLADADGSFLGSVVLEGGLLSSLLPRLAAGGVGAFLVFDGLLEVLQKPLLLLLDFGLLLYFLYLHKLLYGYWAVLNLN